MKRAAGRARAGARFLARSDHHGIAYSGIGMIPGKIVPTFIKPAGQMPAHAAGPVGLATPHAIKSMPPGTGRVQRRPQSGPSLQPTGAGASQPQRTSASVLGKRRRDDEPTPGVFDGKQVSGELDIEEILRQMVEEAEAPIAPEQLAWLSRQPIDFSWLDEPAPTSPIAPPADLVLQAGADVVWVHGQARKISPLQSRILATLLQDKGNALTSLELAQRFGAKDKDAANACSRLLAICGTGKFCNDRGLGYYVPVTVTGGLAQETAPVTSTASPSSSTYCTGDKRMALDLQSRTMRLAGKQDPVSLTFTQCALVRALLQQKGGVLSKETLSKELAVTPKTVPHLVNEVRKVCGKTSILAVYGKGYYILDNQSQMPR